MVFALASLSRTKLCAPGSWVSPLFIRLRQNRFFCNYPKIRIDFDIMPGKRILGSYSFCRPLFHKMFDDPVFKRMIRDHYQPAARVQHICCLFKCFR